MSLFMKEQGQIPSYLYSVQVGWDTDRKKIKHLGKPYKTCAAYVKEKKNKAGNTAGQSRTVGQERKCTNYLGYKNVTDGPTD